MNEYIYTVFLRLYDKFPEGQLRSRVLQCLGNQDVSQLYRGLSHHPGFLFRAQPSLLTAEASSRIMDDIFASDDEDARGRLLKILQDFLTTEAEKHAALQKEQGQTLPYSLPDWSDSSAEGGTKAVSSNGKVDMQELVGNTDGFAESGFVVISTL